MLDWDGISDAIVAKLRSIGDLVTAIGGDAARIQAHHYWYGVESSLEQRVAELKPPAILVAHAGSFWGNFNGQTLYKHRFSVYTRVGSQAGAGSSIGYGALWRLILNGGPVTGWDGLAGPNIGSVQIVQGLDLMEYPNPQPQMDGEQMEFYVGSLTFPEIGDN